MLTRLVSLGVPEQGSHGREAGIPFDTAVSLRTLPWADEPALSPDGKWLAYGVHTPALEAPEQKLSTELRYLQSGTPRPVVGIQLYLTEVATGTARLIGPTSHNSWRPSWSPDSGQCAFFCDAGGMPQLWVHNVASGETRRVADAVLKPNLFPGDEAMWSPDGREVYVRLRPVSRVGTRTTDELSEPGAADGPTVTVQCAGDEAREVEAGARDPGAQTRTYFLEENNATLAAIALHSGAVRRLVAAEAEPRPGCLRCSPSGQWLSYLSVFLPKESTSFACTYDLALVPATGGPVHVVAADLPLPDDPADYWLGTYQWHPAQDLIVYFKDRRVWLVDLGEGEPVPVRQLAERLGDLAPGPLIFSPDGKCLVVRLVGSQEISVPQATTLALIPLDGSEPRAIRLEERGRFMGVWQSSQRTLWQPQPGFLTAVFRVADTSVAVRVDLENGETERLPAETARLRWVRGDDGQRTLVGIFENVSTPPDLYEFSHDLSQRRRLTRVEPRLDAIPVGPVILNETSVPQHDRTMSRVRSALFLPAGARQGDKLPTVVFVYGGQPLSFLAGWFGGGSPATLPTLLFTTRGYAALAPDVPIGPAGTGGNPIQEMTDVLLPQVYHAAELGYTDIERVALIGHSYGGYGVAGVVSQTNLFRAGVAISGSYDLPGQYAEPDPDGTTFQIAWSESGQGCMGTHPWADLQRYLANSPYYQADKIHTPLLLIHGENDWLAHDTRKMFHALKRLGKTAQLASYSGEGHVISEWSLCNAADAARRIIEFLDRHIGSNPSDPAVGPC